MNAPVLVTGASGTIGARVAQLLRGAGVPVRLAARSPEAMTAPRAETVRFDFVDATSWGPAFDGVETAFIVRPPQVSRVRRDMVPALEAAQAAGVRHMVLLSLQGIESAPFVPHAAIEAWMRESGIDWTFVRPSFFMENLTGVHAADIRDRDRIVVPAGGGATSFVAADDVAAVAAVALEDPTGHRGKIWTPTGAQALTYGEVAAELTKGLGRQIEYTRPGAWRFASHARRVLGLPWGMVGVTTALYTVARLGRADGVTDDVWRVTGKVPTSVAVWAGEHADVWQRPLLPS